MPTYTTLAKTPGQFSPVAGADYIYIADETTNAIDIYPLSAICGAKEGTITAGVDAPYGLWFDRASQSLYVANQDNNTVTAYAYGSTTPAATYSQDLHRPLYPIVDRNGNLFVGNANDGTVVEYPAGSTGASQVLHTPGQETDGLAFDQQGNLYVAYRHSNGDGEGGIVEFAPGSTQGQDLGISLTAPQGIVIDASGNIVVAETQAANRIDVFPPQSTAATFNTKLPGNSIPTELAIDLNDANFYVSSLSSIVYGSKYPLPGQTFFVQQNLSKGIQGVTITTNQNF